MEGTEKKRKRKPVLPESEKKRRIVERQTGRIFIREQIQRWKGLQKDQGQKSDAMTAKFLLDHYFESIVSHSMPGPSGIATSTPGLPVDKRILLLQGSELSSVDSDNSARTLTGVSGFESLPESESEKEKQSEETLTAVESENENEKQSEETLTAVESENENEKQSNPLTHQIFLRSGKVAEKKAISSFLDPFELSIDVTFDDEDSEEETDSDYEPDHSITSVLPQNVLNESKEVTFEEMVFDLEKEEDVGEDEQQEMVDLPGVMKIRTEQDINSLQEDTLCLVYLSQLLALAESIKMKCRECNSNSHLSHSFIGSALYLLWSCDKGHTVHRWCSQATLNAGLHTADFLSALAIVTSGNNYGKIALMAKMLKLKFLSSNSFHRIQSAYLVPTVNRFWCSHQDELLSTFEGQQLIVLGDGRMDSPGHCAQYCTYTFMENNTRKIISCNTFDKRETDRKSTNLEKKGFQACLDGLIEKGLHIAEVVTDAHLGIGALMRTQYPAIKHSHDIWHAAKNLGKKIIKAGQKKDCGVLLRWSKDITNHFWWACKEASTYAEFMSIWRSVLHHVCDKHSWALSHGSGVNHCIHGPLPPEDRNKPWLEPNSSAHTALTSVVLDKRFLNKVHYLLNFRNTGDLEVFHQLILMYAAKRYSYSPPVYRMRNQLAALDHNMAVDRPLRRNKENKVMYHRYYNKKSSRWSVQPIKVNKTYEHIGLLTKEALKMRLSDKLGMQRKRELDPQDPRRISTHLAPIAPPSTQQLVEDKVSRF